MTAHRIVGPHRSSIAFAAMKVLAEQPAQMLKEELQGAVLHSYSSATRLEKLVLVHLRSFGFIGEAGERVWLNASGRKFMQPAAPVSRRKKQGESSVTGVAPPYHAPFKPLSLAAYCRLPDTRPGALDYLEHPSLMAGKRVKHGGE